jgi:hypothetical protein
MALGLQIWKLRLSYVSVFSSGHAACKTQSQGLLQVGLPDSKAGAPQYHLLVQVSTVLQTCVVQTAGWHGQGTGPAPF